MHISFECTNCGSDLKISPEQFASFKCKNCNTSFKVDNQKNTITSRTNIDKYQGYGSSNSDSMILVDKYQGYDSSNLDSLTLEEKLNKIDYEWFLEQENYKVYSKRSGRVLPNKIAIIAYKY